MYRERLPKTWTAFCVGVYLALVVKLGIDAVPEDTGLWLTVSASFLLVLLPCVAVPISKAVYHRVAVDPDRGVLRVGRERFALADIDPASVHAALREPAPGTAARYAASAQAVDVPVPGLRAADRGAPRLAGGGWGVPLGMDAVVVGLRDGGALSVATHDRDAFLTALAAALPPEA
ncbi:hypothetical protein [Streptomyces sudanensis]|uniref:hypothetical protein n=1 Tax=Streptomyces sudanensis TaxID=436397 RepID=UPI0020CD5183|nr:hypothetical protein [Streptomyces sudanensis]MCP9960112.1 hypothetical protein [Streptomyces sudanensis]MCP9999498.1 hypothetical protein [Streptomyces sudanensis]